MISEEEEAGKLFDRLINRDECIKRIMDIEKILYPNNFPVLYSGISRDAFISYVFGSFSGSIILSAVLLETALQEARIEKSKKNFEKTPKTSGNTTKVYKEESVTRGKSKSSKTKIAELKFWQLIKEAYSEGLISEESMEIADFIRHCRNDLAHSSYKDVAKRIKAGSNPTEDWCQSSVRDKKANEDTAKRIINSTKKILLEIYSN